MLQSTLYERGEPMGRDIPQYKCPICGNYTMFDPENYEICPVCGWKNKSDCDNYEQLLWEAQDEYLNLGHVDNAKMFRNPLPSELPWIHEHEPETSGDDKHDGIVDLYRILSYQGHEISRRPDLFMAAADTIFNRCIKEGPKGNYEETDMFQIYQNLEGYGAFGLQAQLKLAMCFQYGFGTKRDGKNAEGTLSDAVDWTNSEKEAFDIEKGVLKSFNSDWEEAYIPFGVTDVGNGTYKPFKENQTIQELHVFHPVNIGSKAFENCSNLKTLYFYFGALDKPGDDFFCLYDMEDGPYHIAPDAFEGCNIEKLIICNRNSERDAESAAEAFRRMLDHGNEVIE